MRKKIVIVDDERVGRYLIAKVLEKEGYNTVLASTGLGGLQIVRDNPDVALVITDVVMPDLDGRELATIIRSEKKRARLPIIIVSGLVALKEVSSIIELEHTRFLPKPIRTDDLLKYTEVLLQEHQQLSSSRLAANESDPRRAPS